MTRAAVFLLSALRLTQSHPITAQSHPRPLDPTRMVVRSFARTPLVGLGEVHRNVETHAVLSSLLTDPRFQMVVDDIVVEFGNALYQRLVDRYLIQLADPDAELANIWRNTTQVHSVWDAPMYEAFFTQVRRVNESLPRENRLRVILGGPPIDWDGMVDRDTLGWYSAQRDTHLVDVLEDQVLALNRSALVVVGGAHLDRTRPTTVAGILAARQPGALTVILPVLDDSAAVRWSARLSLSPPVIILPDGNWAGAEDAGALFGPRRGMVRRNGQWVEFEEPARMGRPLRDYADLVLYLGRPSEFNYRHPPSSLGLDVRYCEALRARWRLADIPRASHPCA